VSDIRPLHAPEAGEAEWKPVRHHFGINAFGVNAFVARDPGDFVVEEHAEADESGTGHEELYLVTSGRAAFTVAGEELDAPAGTLVFVPDPNTRRAAVAHEAGTTVLAFGATPDVAFTISPWERKYTGD
jgi:hypothetical protein